MYMVAYIRIRVGTYIIYKICTYMYSREIIGYGAFPGTEMEKENNKCCD